MQRKYINGLTSLALPLNTLIKVSAKIPAEIPLAIEPVKIVNIIIMIGPNVSTKSEKSIEEIFVIIKTPTKISAGPVAALGIINTHGDKKIITKKINEVTTEAKPVLPPASTPADDSTKVVIVVLPVHAPTHVPIASTKNGFWISGKLPSLSSIPALAPTPNTVPKVEKKSPQKVAKIRGMVLTVNTDLKSKLNIMFPRPFMSGTLAKDAGIEVTPNGMPNKVTTTIPIKISPVTFLACNTAIKIKPKIAR